MKGSVMLSVNEKQILKRRTKKYQETLLYWRKRKAEGRDTTGVLSKNIESTIMLLHEHLELCLDLGVKRVEL